MGGGLMEMIQKLLGGMGGQGGVDQFGANANGRIMPQDPGQVAAPVGGTQSPGGYNAGLMSGMSGGNSSGRGQLDTSASDHALGMSALGHYQDMSHPEAGMGGLVTLANMGRNQPWKVQEQQSPNDYVKYLMGGMRGGR